MRTALIICIMLCAASAAPDEEKTQPAAPAEEKEQPAAAGGEVEHLAAAAPDAADVAVPELQDYQQLLEEDELSATKGKFLSCPSGWERLKGTCYLYVGLYKSWTDAEAYCVERGAVLTSIRSAFEQRFLKTLTLEADVSHAWTGGFFFKNWRWLDPSPFGWHYTPTGGYNRCIFLRTLGNWDTDDCDYRKPFICMMRADGC